MLVYLNIFIPILAMLFVAVMCHVVLPPRYGLSGNILVIAEWAILPLILIILNLSLYFRKVGGSPFKYFILMFSGLTSTVIVNYLVWGATSGKLLKPDGGTIYLTYNLIIYYFVITLIFIIIMDLTKVISQRKKKK